MFGVELAALIEYGFTEQIMQPNLCEKFLPHFKEHIMSFLNPKTGIWCLKREIASLQASHAPHIE